MSFQLQQPQTLPPAAQSADALRALASQDHAVEFLNGLIPTSPAERTRAFAALLRAMTSESRR